jgi:hypothetical protein
MARLPALASLHPIAYAILSAYVNVMAARIKKLLHDDETRARIKVGNIIHRFQQCVDGEIVLDAQQISAGKALLNKILPDLSSTVLKGDASNPLMIVSKDQRDAAVIAATRSNR